MQLAATAQRFRRLRVGHGLQVAEQLAQAAMHGLRQVIAHQQQLGYALRRDCLARDAPICFERGHRAQQHGPFRRFGARAARRAHPDRASALREAASVASARSRNVPMRENQSASSRTIVPAETPRVRYARYFTHSRNSPRPDSGIVALNARDSR